MVDHSANGKASNVSFRSRGTANRGGALGESSTARRRGVRSSTIQLEDYRISSQRRAPAAYPSSCPYSPVGLDRHNAIHYLAWTYGAVNSALYAVDHRVEHGS